MIAKVSASNAVEFQCFFQEPLFDIPILSTDCIFKSGKVTARMNQGGVVSITDYFGKRGDIRKIVNE